MNTKSIGFKLTAVMLVIILLGILFTVGVATIISGNTVIDESLKKAVKSTQLEKERLDNWLFDQLANTDTMAAFLSTMDDLADILMADQADMDQSLEEQTYDTLQPLLNSVLIQNSEYFEIYYGLLDGTAVTGSGYQFNYAAGWRALSAGGTSWL